ncbi:DUF177 domain-containing protein [Sphingopyxis sp.]|uniref:YceD family protein n=1 Tax=Sphingopyxis sp. TaxID=1908224 RepID=UPI0026156242|nr:DUF177 domain-containing protein [Sphingopyxis sp.]MCW0199116.1 DUF177 domain-containing protein [Sphingopyxis sp.]
MTAPEFSHIVTLAEAGQGRAVAIEADQAARAAIARRLGLVALGRFAVTAEVRSVAGGIAAAGTIDADIVQSCAATGLPVPATLHEPFDLRFLRDASPAGSSEEEVEISDADCDILPLEGERIDLGEAAVQTLSLALDPFPRHPDADRILAEKGVLSEDQAGPFAALAKLRGQDQS